jgi:hypothetical protein
MILPKCHCLIMTSKTSCITRHEDKESGNQMNGLVRTKGADCKVSAYCS